MTTIPLRSPIKAHGETLEAITLRRPNGKDQRVCGVPYKLTQYSEVMIEAASMHRMIAELAGVPPSSIDQMDGADWNQAAQEVLGFIMEPQKAKTPPPQTAD